MFLKSNLTTPVIKWQTWNLNLTLVIPNPFFVRVGQCLNNRKPSQMIKMEVVETLKQVSHPHLAGQASDSNPMGLIFATFAF